MRFILIAFLILSHSSSLAQEVDSSALDSLKNELRLRNRSYAEKQSILKELAKEYYNLGENDSAIECFQRYFDLAQLEKDSSEMSFALKDISWYFYLNRKLDTALVYAERALVLATLCHDTLRMAQGHIARANALMSRAAYQEAIRHYMVAAEYAEKMRDNNVVAACYHNLAIVHQLRKDYNTAVSFGYKAHEFHKKERTETNPYVSELIGGIFSEMGEPDSAKYHYELSIKRYTERGIQAMLARVMSKYASVEIDRGELDHAKKLLDTADKIYEEIAIPSFLINHHKVVSKYHFARSELMQAINFSKSTFTRATEYNSFDHQPEVLKLLSNAYAGLGKFDSAYHYLTIYNQVSDSVDMLEASTLMNELEFSKKALKDSLEFEKQEAIRLLEIEKQSAQISRQKIGLISAILGLLLIVALAYSIKRGKQKSDDLLLNILPADIAAELKEKGRADARDFEMVSILFTDFKGFTAASEKLSAQDLVSEINTCFEAFDGIMGKYGIEKIKTIGDAYMAAGGLPFPTDDSVKNTVLAALEMQDFISKRKVELDAEGKPCFEMRVGVHTGPVVAGIVGVKKFQYDIWGDTVNTASRMESSGEVGKVNISEATYKLLKDDASFSFASRGKIEAKGKGEMEMFFVEATS